MLWKMVLAVAVTIGMTTLAFAQDGVGDTTEKYSPLPKMIDLGSKFCIPCKKMAPILNELREKYEGKAEIVFIDIKENRKAAAQYRITIIPTQIFFDTLGAETYRHVGFFSADSIEAHLAELGAPR